MEDKKNILSIRIKELRTELGLTQEELAKKLGLNNKSSIANYESGYSIPSDEIKKKMCEIFECSMDYLMGQSNFKTYQENLENYKINQNKITILKTIERYYYEYVVPCSLKEADINRIVDLLSNINRNNVNEVKSEITKLVNSFDTEKKLKVRKFINIVIKELIDDLSDKSRFLYLCNLVENENKNKTATKSNYYMCPVYGRIAAGQPNWAEECMEGQIPIDPELMNIINPEECYFLKVNGESMNKVIKNGAFALIRKTDWIENGEIAVVLVNGFDATLKKFTKQGDLVILEPMSDDPNFTTQVYNKDTEIKIIGKYIGKMEMN